MNGNICMNLRGQSNIWIDLGGYFFMKLIKFSVLLYGYICLIMCVMVNYSINKYLRRAI